MTWRDINVFQWQQLAQLYTTEGMREIDIKVKTVSIIYNLTEPAVDSLPYKELVRLYNDAGFLDQEIQPKPEPFILVGKKRYRCIYDVRRLPFARYIETKYFASEVNDNLHNIAACMVMPQRRTLFGWKDLPYDATRHAEYAQDMLEAPITAVLGSVVFFWNVYAESMKASRGFLRNQLAKRMPKKQAEALAAALWISTDGLIKPRWLLNMKE